MDRSRSRRPTQPSSSSAGRDTRLRAECDGDLVFDWGVNGEWKTWQVTIAGIKVLQLHGYGAGDRISAAIYSRLVAVGGICSLGVSERASVPTEKATRQ